jgi:hypothetical protein
MAKLPDNPHRILNAMPTWSQSAFSPGDICREAWQSQFSIIVHEMVTTDIISEMTKSSFLEWTTSTIFFDSPIVSAGVFTSTTYLPTECDGYTRLSKNTYTEIQTAMFSLSSFFKLRSGSVIPFSPTPTSTYTQTHRTEMGPWSTLTCNIPRTECSQQWNQFKTFLRTWKPDFGDMAAAFAYYETRLNSLGGQTKWGNESLTGSNLMDSLLELTYHRGAAVEDFFGGCVEAQKHVFRGIQLYREFWDWNNKWRDATQNATSSGVPFRLDERSPDEVREILRDFCSCNLQTDHGILIHFEHPKVARKRDICANDGWGDTPESADEIRSAGESAPKTTLTAITFPEHWNPSKLNESLRIIVVLKDNHR